jgi:hypothetical protein
VLKDRADWPPPQPLNARDAQSFDAEHHLADGYRERREEEDAYLHTLPADAGEVGVGAA